MQKMQTFFWKETGNRKISKEQKTITTGKQECYKVNYFHTEMIS